MAETSFDISSKDFHAFYKEFKKRFIAFAYPDGLPIIKNDDGVEVAQSEDDPKIWYKTKNNRYVFKEIVGPTNLACSYFWDKARKIAKSRPEDRAIVHAVLFSKSMKFLGFNVGENPDFEDIELSKKALKWFKIEKGNKAKNDNEPDAPSDPTIFPSIIFDQQLKSDLEEFWHFLEAGKMKEAYDKLTTEYKIRSYQDRIEPFISIKNCTKEYKEICAFNINHEPESSSLWCMVYYKAQRDFKSFSASFNDLGNFDSCLESMEELIAFFLKQKKFELDIDDVIWENYADEFWESMAAGTKSEDERKVFNFLREQKVDIVSTNLLHCRFLKTNDIWYLDRANFVMKKFELNLGFKISRKMRNEDPRF